MIIVLMPVRNEAWVIGYSLRAALRWCDAACVLLHACEDETPSIVAVVAEEHPGRVFVGEVADPEWMEATHRRMVLDMGRSVGGDRFAVIDADEVVTANLVGWVRGRIERLRPGEVLEVPWLQLWKSRDAYAPDRNNLMMPLAWADDGSGYRVNGYQMHQRIPAELGHPLRKASRRDQVRGGLMHLQRLSWRRAMARQAKFKAHDMAHWGKLRGGVAVTNLRHDRSLALGEQVRLAEVPPEWWEHGLDHALVHAGDDEDSWEEREVRRLVAEHGPWPGLNLYGIS